MVKSVQVIVLKSKIVQKLLTAYKKLRFSASKVMEFLQNLWLNMSCTQNSYVAFKSDGVASKFCANMSCTKMNVVMIYFYSKRFRFAPSFNN